MTNEYEQSQLELGKRCKTGLLGTLVLVLFTCQVIQEHEETITVRRKFWTFRKDLIMSQKP